MELIISNAHCSAIKRILHACIRENLLNWVYKDSAIVITFEKLTKIICIQNVNRYSLSRFEMSGDVLIISKSKVKKISTVEQLFRIIKNEIKIKLHGEQLKKIFAEIKNSILNDASAQKHFQVQNKDLIKDISASTLIDLISQKKISHAKMIFFEQWSSFRGHPYHPCYKTKMGFSSIDNLNYSPEFGQTIPLNLIAIKKQMLHFEHQDSKSNYHYWFAMNFAMQWEALKKAAKTNKFCLDDYYPIFVHPWQVKNIICKLFKYELKNKQFILLNDIVINTKPTLSSRTLISDEDPLQPHIKLPLSIQSTSSLRTLSPTSVKKGPPISKILKNILMKENNFNDAIKLSDEICGLHLKHENINVAKHLAVIFRKNPNDHLNDLQTPIVVSALFEISPKTSLPLFIEILQQAVGTSLESAKDYFQDYCQIVLTAYLDFYLIYGIALEGHQQNTIAVFENNKLKFIVARDLVSGVIIHAPTLVSKGFSIDNIPNFGTMIEDEREVRNNFLHSVIQYHLGELILILAKNYQCSENFFWKIVKNGIEKRFEMLKDRIAPERYTEEYKSILTSDWNLKGLLRMRFEDIYNESIYLPLQNPLKDL